MILVIAEARQGEAGGEQENGGTYTVTVTGDAKSRASHKHRLRTALSRVRVMVTALENGYRWDDAQAALYAKLLAEAHATLDAELGAWETVYGEP